MSRPSCKCCGKPLRKDIVKLWVPCNALLSDEIRARFGYGASPEVLTTPGQIKERRAHEWDVYHEQRRLYEEADDKERRRCWNHAPEPRDYRFEIRVWNHRYTAMHGYFCTNRCAGEFARAVIEGGK